ncbi:hypothetical protein D3C73_1512150 [compost metagenome]
MRLLTGPEGFQLFMELTLPLLLLLSIFVADLAGSCKLQPFAFSEKQLDAELLFQTHDFAGKRRL